MPGMQSMQSMQNDLTLMIHLGELPCLTALAMAADGDTARHVTLWHPAQDQPDADHRRTALTRQAEHYHVHQTLTQTLSDLPSNTKSAKQPTPSTTATPLKTPLMLALAVRAAIHIGAKKIIWPVTTGGDFDALALATEQALIVRQLAELEHHPAPSIDTPLAELTDREMIEVAAHLGAPFELARSCLGTNEQPCLDCPGCTRRRAAFETAGILDPLEEPALR